MNIFHKKIKSPLIGLVTMALFFGAMVVYVSRPESSYADHPEGDLAPDYIISDVKLSYTSPIQRGKLKVEVKTKNIGEGVTSTTSNSKWDVYDQDAGHVKYTGGNFSVPALGHLAVNYQYYVITCQPGTAYDIDAKADNTDAIAESMEGNNEREALTYQICPES